MVTDKVFDIIGSTDFINADHYALKSLQIGRGSVRHGPTEVTSSKINSNAFQYQTLQIVILCKLLQRSFQSVDPFNFLLLDFLNEKKKLPPYRTPCIMHSSKFYICVLTMLQ